ncbi:hypothetical protein ABT369_25595 [Dactylosporangium sp. NPDC000244]|uniref:hypothetical protein n=1 Tax=Dactylosporangium sp. NPDC000244 TaxID=3154365 RepID=UPI0033272536
MSVSQAVAALSQAGPLIQAALAVAVALLGAGAVLQLALWRLRARPRPHHRPRAPLALGAAPAAEPDPGPPEAWDDTPGEPVDDPLDEPDEPFGRRVSDGAEEESGRDADAIVRAEVVAGPTAAAVSLIGARPYRGAPAFRWTAPGVASAYRPATVVLGVHPEHGALVVDLAAAPDVITVTGAHADRIRYARYLAGQLLAGGTTVVAGEELMGRSDTPHPASGALAVVFHAGPRGTPPPAGPGGVPTVLVLVGDVPRARWSIVARPRGAAG